jgi:NADH-quinone oxidoreductase subunit D
MGDGDALIRPTSRAPMEIEEQVDGDLGAKRMVVNFGPQHPATHGTLRSIMEIEGEVVTSMELEIGYLHTGFEKLANTGRGTRRSPSATG